MEPCSLLPLGYTPQSKDILCGKNKLAFNHEGNVNFRATVAEFLQRYLAQKSRSDRGRLIANVVEILHMEGKRFLKEEKGGRWAVVPPQKARCKVGHALRDTAANCKGKEDATEHPSLRKLGGIRDNHSAPPTFLSPQQPPVPQFFNFFPNTVLQNDDTQITFTKEMQPKFDNPTREFGGNDTPPLVFPLAAPQENHFLASIPTHLKNAFLPQEARMDTNGNTLKLARRRKTGRGGDHKKVKPLLRMVHPLVVPPPQVVIYTGPPSGGEQQLKHHQFDYCYGKWPDEKKDKKKHGRSPPTGESELEHQFLAQSKIHERMVRKLKSSNSGPASTRPVITRPVSNRPRVKKLRRVDYYIEESDDEEKDVADDDEVARAASLPEMVVSAVAESRQDGTKRSSRDDHDGKAHNHDVQEAVDCRYAPRAKRGDMEEDDDFLGPVPQAREPFMARRCAHVDRLNQERGAMEDAPMDIPTAAHGGNFYPSPEPVVSYCSEAHIGDVMGHHDGYFYGGDGCQPQNHDYHEAARASAASERVDDDFPEDSSITSSKASDSSDDCYQDFDDFVCQRQPRYYVKT